MARITVKHRHGQSFDIRVRGSALISDEPVTLGGGDEGPTPTELMVAGLAACAADEVVNSLKALGARAEATEVGADFTWDSKGNRVASIRVSVSFPDEIGDNARKSVLLAVLSCPARKMLSEPPRVEYEFNAAGIPMLVGPGLDGSSWPDEPPPDVDSER
jgi:putative redox protein